MLRFTTPACYVFFLLLPADPDMIWRWKQRSLILPLFTFPPGRSWATFTHPIQRGLISGEIQIHQRRRMNFNYCRRCSSCAAAFHLTWSAWLGEWVCTELIFGVWALTFSVATSRRSRAQRCTDWGVTVIMSPWKTQCIQSREQGAVETIIGCRRWRWRR